MASLPTANPSPTQAPLLRLPQRILKHLLVCLTPYAKLNAATSDDALLFSIGELKREWKLTLTAVSPSPPLFEQLIRTFLEPVACYCCVSWSPCGLILSATRVQDLFRDICNHAGLRIPRSF